VKIDLSKTSHILFFVVFLPFVSFGIGWAVTHIVPANLPFWVETISPLGAYGLLYAFFDRSAWHWPLFRWLGIVTMPDIRGRWEGPQLSYFKKANGKPTRSFVVLEIVQTFSSITTKSYYHRWNDAHSASCFLDIDGQLYLVILFESAANMRHDGGGTTANQGVNRLQYLPDDKMLVGSYFNNTGNIGEVRLHRTGRKLLHRFAA
jgi:SMODS-associating 2TM, beta-strand rich effector domain